MGRRLRPVDSATLRPLWLSAYYSSQKARRTLGYAPRPVRWGVREALRWFQEQGELPRQRPLAPRGPLLPQQLEGSEVEGY
jgi:dihydroflavonol-4-reductase